MMQFIVLGLIPGTHVQLTFAGFALVFIGVAGTVVYRFYRAHNAGTRQRLQRSFDVISLRSLDQA